MTPPSGSLHYTSLNPCCEARALSSHVPFVRLKYSEFFPSVAQVERINNKACQMHPAPHNNSTPPKGVRPYLWEPLH